jgi:hypothetical protein
MCIRILHAWMWRLLSDDHLRLFVYMSFDIIEGDRKIQTHTPTQMTSYIYTPYPVRGYYSYTLSTMMPRCNCCNVVRVKEGKGTVT